MKLNEFEIEVSPEELTAYLAQYVATALTNGHPDNNIRYRLSVKNVLGNSDEAWLGYLKVELIEGQTNGN